MGFDWTRFSCRLWLFWLRQIKRCRFVHPQALHHQAWRSRKRRRKVRDMKNSDENRQAANGDPNNLVKTVRFVSILRLYNASMMPELAQFAAKQDHTLFIAVIVCPMLPTTRQRCASRRHKDHFQLWYFFLWTCGQKTDVQQPVTFPAARPILHVFRHLYSDPRWAVLVLFWFLFCFVLFLFLFCFLSLSISTSLKTSE